MGYAERQIGHGQLCPECEAPLTKYSRRGFWCSICKVMYHINFEKNCLEASHYNF